MKNDMTKSYLLLNSLAAQGGIVIFGGSEDTNIPLSELKQAFALNSNFYNRSVDGLSVRNAGELYDLYVSALNPECLLLHIGDSDIDLFSENADKFDNLLRALIRHIKAHDRHCEIALISIRNPANADTINEMNRHLKYIADSERCRYFDITNKRVWNPRETQRVVSFVYSIGFVRPLNNKHPLGDMIKVLFCYDQTEEARPAFTDI